MAEQLQALPEGSRDGGLAKVRENRATHVPETENVATLS